MNNFNIAESVSWQYPDTPNDTVQQCQSKCAALGKGFKHLNMPGDFGGNAHRDTR